ncbi:DUF1294 domain-containing protein [Iodobacter fluviatilis]|uniref:Protein of uncharacterized function (DUF1294) n=1 Tax=Iodobacter fluviatilis TaxID=537 RepID=A0A377Q4H9_9NEIS|nr:DUF1294 domain-containing protein [Iodobacter fluviatilis]TCU84104.1 uncharacterized membrane protein YsdA (DUF1294 family) [Iodobacter fluviatilis]STQ89717.1 Protein of uncharacterised function (DUF1294) [Iodobacter fluviatilis]
MRFQGKITSWKDDQGFGFVVQNGGGERAFLHIKAFENRTQRPAEGDLITYVQVRDDRGRFRAEQVCFVGQRRVAAAESGQGSGSVILALLFAAFLVSACFIGRLPWLIAGGYLLMSIVAFIAYALDKSAARNDRWRTPESTLHLLALLGGWPGALLAQRVLRHKSKKAAFLLVFWATVLMNCAALAWVLLRWR